MVYPQNEHDEINLLETKEKYVTQRPEHAVEQKTERASTGLSPPVKSGHDSARCGDINCREKRFAPPRH
jgi:hypothetical protein